MLTAQAALDQYTAIPQATLYRSYSLGTPHTVTTTACSALLWGSLFELRSLQTPPLAANHFVSLLHTEYLYRSLLQQDTQCPIKVTLRRVRITVVVENSKSYSDCVYVALVIQHAKRMRRIILSVASSVLPHYLIEGTILEKKVTERKTCVLVFCTAFRWNTSQYDKNSAKYCHNCAQCSMLTHSLPAI